MTTTLQSQLPAGLASSVISLVVWGALGLGALIFIVYYFVFRFHWKYYGFNVADRRFAIATFTVVSFVLLVVAVALALMYESVI